MKEITLQAFKKANKEARERMAKKRGYTSAEKMLEALKNPKKKDIDTGGKTKPSRRRGNEAKVKVKRFEAFPDVKPVIHNIHILDRSGSMHGGKLQNAIEGINKEIEELKKDDTVDYTQTIVDFDTSSYTTCYKQPIALVKKYSTRSGGSTALNQTVGETLEMLLERANGTDKYLVKIFTDGQDNASYGKYPTGRGHLVGELIKQCEEKGFTVTFVGTEADVLETQKVFSIDASNTLVHDNTAKGVQNAFNQTIVATMSFSADVKAGKEVTRGFYKKVGKL